MTKVWCVRANGGEFTQHFLNGSYVGIGWIEIIQDLGSVSSRDELYAIVQSVYPDIGQIVIGNYVGQLARFLIEMKAGDYVITPSAETEWLHYGKVDPDPSYYFAEPTDGCRYRHRRRVTWCEGRLNRSDFSVPFQNTIRSALSVFGVSQVDEFLSVIGVGPPLPPPLHSDPYRVVLEQILELNDKEFELLVGHLLNAIGFDGAEVTGRTGDGGVDATGELDVANLAKVKVYVQVKRYRIGSRISASVVRQLRQAIPFGGQGAFITTSDFQRAAADVALEPGFPRIGLINGRQLVELLIEHWNDIPQDFQERLKLKPGLVRA